MSRSQIFGRLIAIATVLHERVAEAGMPPLFAKYLDKLQRAPVKTLTQAHTDIMQLAYKFGEYENFLLDAFAVQMAQLDLSTFNDEPLDATYLQAYYSQKKALADMLGYKEVYELLGWDYATNRTKLNTYWKVRKTFPAPVKILASGPLWSRAQVEYYKDAQL